MPDSRTGLSSRRLDDRLLVVEVAQARQAAQLEDHERVQRSIETHLAELVAQFATFRIQILVATLIIFAGTQNGAKLASTVAGLVH